VPRLKQAASSFCCSLSPTYKPIKSPKRGSFPANPSWQAIRGTGKLPPPLFLKFPFFPPARSPGRVSFPKSLLLSSFVPQLIESNILPFWQSALFADFGTGFFPPIFGFKHRFFSRCLGHTCLSLLDSPVYKDLCPSLSLLTALFPATPFSSTMSSPQGQIPFSFIELRGSCPVLFFPRPAKSFLFYFKL